MSETRAVHYCRKCGCYPTLGKCWCSAASSGDYSFKGKMDSFIKPAPVFDRAAFLKRQGLAAPTAIGPDDSAAIGNALRFGK